MSRHVGGETRREVNSGRAADAPASDLVVVRRWVVLVAAAPAASSSTATRVKPKPLQGRRRLWLLRQLGRKSRRMRWLS